MTTTLTLLQLGNSYGHGKTKTTLEVDRKLTAVFHVQI